MDGACSWNVTASPSSMNEFYRFDPLQIGSALVFGPVVGIQTRRTYTEHKTDPHF
jgi:hypothetical protein